MSPRTSSLPWTSSPHEPAEDDGIRGTFLRIDARVRGFFFFIVLLMFIGEVRTVRSVALLLG